MTMHGAQNYAELELSAALIRIRSKLDEIQSDDASLNAIDDIPQKSGCLRHFRLICVCVCVVFAAAAGLHALPVLTQFTISGGVNGATVGTFDGGGSGLANISDLSDTSAADRQYVAQYFKPTVTGSYTFGLSKSTKTRC